MKRLVSVILLAALVDSQVTGPVLAQVTGTISGVIAGPKGPIAGVNINIVDAAGNVVGKTVTTSSGAYSVGNLPVGTYDIVVVGQKGAVIATGTGTVTATTVTATVNLTLTAGQLAAAGIAAGGAGWLSTTTILYLAGGAGGGLFATAALRSDPSPTQ